jgi:hypothetical protein
MRSIVLIGSICLATAVAAQPNNPFAPTLPTGPGPYSGAPPDPNRPQIPPQIHPGIPHIFCVSSVSAKAAMMFVTYVFQSTKPLAQWENDLDSDPSIRMYEVHFNCMTDALPPLLEKRNRIIAERRVSFREISVKSDF